MGLIATLTCFVCLFVVRNSDSDDSLVHSHISKGNWHKLMPRVRFGSFTFMVGPVPIVVGVDGQLNGMAVVDRDISASVSMGAEMAAEGRFGVDWQKDQGWEKIADASWKFTYWEPAWDFGLDDEGERQKNLSSCFLESLC